MNKVIEDIKLDFEDVLIYPVPSDKSLTRKSVDIEIDWLENAQSVARPDLLLSKVL